MSSALSARVLPWIGAGLGILTAVVFVFAMSQHTQLGLRFSVIDEMVHVDYVVHLREGTLPKRGDLLATPVVYETDCGIGLPDPAAEPNTQKCGADWNRKIPPQGAWYSSAYIHLPTFYLGGLLAYGSYDGPGVPMSSLRLYGTLMMALGLAACVAGGAKLGLRGWQLGALATLPVAAPVISHMAWTFNPSSTSILLGALVATAGLLWVRRGTGFVWFALATAAASLVALTWTFPVAPFLFLGLWKLVKAARGERSGWQPRWWQLVVPALLVAVPQAIWGRVISARAAVPNSEVYSFLPPATLPQAVKGAALELIDPHSPWIATPRTPAPDQWSAFADALAAALPGMITILVLGALAVYAFARLPGRTEPVPGQVAHAYDAVPDLRRLAGCTLLSMLGYAPFLHLANWFTFGFDNGIVARYSLGFVPLTLMLVLLLTKSQRYAALLAVVGLAQVGATIYLLLAVPTFLR